MKRRHHRYRVPRARVTASFLTGAKIHHCADPECLLRGEREW